MSKAIEDRIECPFYLGEGNCSVICEGILKGTKCIHRFPSKEIKDTYENSVCCSAGGSRCNHFKSVSSLYERGLRI